VGPQETMEKLFVYVAGKARGKPGAAAIGIAITDKQGNVIEEVSRLIGRSIPQAVVYQALIEGCKRTFAYSPQSVIFFTDNQSVVNQLNGILETRQPPLQHLLEISKGCLNKFPEWRVNFIDSNVNRKAPRLVEQAFHNRIQAEMTHEHLDLRLLAYTASLSNSDMEQLIEHAKRLQDKR